MKKVIKHVDAVLEEIERAIQILIYIVALNELTKLPKDKKRKKRK